MLCFGLLLTGCSGNGSKDDISNNGGHNNQTENNNNIENNETESGTQGEVADLGDDNKTLAKILRTREHTMDILRASPPIL